MNRRIVIAFLLLLTFCVSTPETNRSALNLIGSSQMSTMGIQAYQEMRSKEKISTDPKINEMVTRIGKRIAKASGFDYEWEFTVFDEPKTVNAFCLPGGKIGVYTGILPVAKTEAALAAIMGHEVAHATAQHGNERLSQSLILQLGLQASQLAFNDSKQKNLIMAGLGLGAQVGVMLPYGRMQESEADKIGLIYMARAGYEPIEAVNLWDRMDKHAGRSSPPEILSTHPNSQKRMEKLRSQIPEVMPLYEKSHKQPPRTI